MLMVVHFGLWGSGDFSFSAILFSIFLTGTCIAFTIRKTKESKAGREKKKNIEYNIGAILE